MSYPTPLQPQTYPRRILLAVAAKSPQIITETIYALACQTTAWLPTELHIITTGRGARNIQQALGEHGANWLQKLCIDYQLPSITLSEKSIHVITTPQNQALEDIRNSADNACAADYITQWVRTFTADPQSCLYASLSGGRRTMTYYMGYAMSLFGRPQDRLTHVLIEDDYFFNDDFFYPPPYSKLIPCKDGAWVDAQTIEVTLADLPFIRLRDTLPLELLSGKQRFTDLIVAAQAQITQPNVQFNAALKQLYCHGQLIKMPPLQLVFYVWMLERRVQQVPPVRWVSQEPHNLSHPILRIYKSLYGETGHFEKIKHILNQDLNQDWFDEHKSKTNSFLKKQLKLTEVSHYLIHAHGKKPNTRFGLALSSNAIEFLNE